MSKKCSSKDHQKIPAIYYCQECEIFMCQKCEQYHLKIFYNHKVNDLDKNIDENIYGVCKEKNHSEKLEFFCKTHNKLCCSSCIIKIKKKGKGQHTDCDICLIEDIKDEKIELLSKNIKILEDLSKTLDKSIIELKEILNKMSQNKNELKLKIQKTFTEIKNKINEREDKLLLEIDRLYEDTIISYNKLKKIDNIPSIIELKLKKGIKAKNELEEDYDKLNIVINESINIEKYILKINQNNQIINKYKNQMNSTIKFYDEKKDSIQKFHNNFISFGKEYKIFISDNINEIYKNSNIDIEIKGLNNEIKNGISFELFGFNSKQYLQYYSTDNKYEENENFVLTFCLEGDDEDTIDSLIEILNQFNLRKELLSMKKKDNKLFFEIRYQNELDIENIKNIFNEINECIFILKNNIDLSQFLKMDYNTFFNSLLSFYIAIKGKSSILHTLISFLQKKTDELEQNIIKKEKEYEENENKNNGFFSKIMDGISFFFLSFDKLTIGLLKILIYFFNSINIIRNIKINYLADNLLQFLRNFIEEENLTDYFNKIKKFPIDIIKEIKNNDFKNLLKKINWDKFLIYFLFVKYKSGFVFRIKANGLTNIIHDIIEEKYELNLEKDNKEFPLVNEDDCESNSDESFDEIEKLIK